MGRIAGIFSRTSAVVIFAIAFVLSSAPMASILSISCPFEANHYSVSSAPSANDLTHDRDGHTVSSANEVSIDSCCAAACAPCKTLIGTNMSTANVSLEAIPPPAREGSASGIATAPTLGPPRT